MKKTLASLLSLALLLGVLTTSSLAADLETVQEGPFTITNVTSTNYYSDGTPDYNCEDYTTITVNQDTENILFYYFNYTSDSWEHMSFYSTYGESPIFDSTNTSIILTDTDEIYALADYREGLIAGTIDGNAACLILAGTSFYVLAPLDFNVVAIYPDGSYEECYFVVSDSDGIVTTPADVTTEAESEEVIAEEAAPSSGTAVATSSPVLVDGVDTAFEAYNISDNNYFKLRDIAQILSGTDAQFSVEWDGDKEAISLTTGTAYTTVGGEMAIGDGSAKEYIANTSTIYLNGEEVSLMAYTINDNNYFKLRDLGDALGFYVAWDSDLQTIIIVSDGDYAAD